MVFFLSYKAANKMKETWRVAIILTFHPSRAINGGGDAECVRTVEAQRGPSLSRQAKPRIGTELLTTTDSGSATWRQIGGWFEGLRTAFLTDAVQYATNCLS